MNITPNTELGAINSILFTIGVSPVNSLSEGNLDVVGAQAKLQAASAAVQDKGWAFNIQEGLPIQADALTRKIKWRPNWLKVMASGGETPYINRGGFLYDRLTRTDEFPGGITADVIELQPFDTLPLCFKRYITAKAAKDFNNGAFGDPATDQANKEEMLDSWADCQTYELDYGDFGIFEDTYVQGQLGRR